MKVGDTVYAEVFFSFDIREVKIKRETAHFFVFEIEGKELRRKKNKFTKTKQEALESNIDILTGHLLSLNTNPQEVYEKYKEILKIYMRF